MTIRNAIAAAALSTVALLSGTGFAADFGAQLNEAKAEAADAARETREVAAIHLSAAAGYARSGNQASAQQYLNFARGKLGLPVTQAQAAQPVVASGAAAQATQDNGITGLRPEAH
ncbi:hypothetical protein [Azospirillum sp. SYSU D00513]|uniref:hypothetical protein n=1 Tax=Azospirillum sp. SYSU D00513 TaxID=2812561 RepID=UPI001A968AF4|nr:hypothetical protein [Azospirillum sp. SYSU D00513]